MEKSLNFTYICSVDNLVFHQYLLWYLINVLNFGKLCWNIVMMILANSGIEEKCSAWLDLSVVKFLWKSVEPCWSSCPFWTFVFLLFLMLLLPKDTTYWTEFNGSWNACSLGYPAQNGHCFFLSIKITWPLLQKIEAYQASGEMQARSSL